METNINEALIEKIKKIVHIALPFPMLIEKYWPRVREEGLSLEVGLDHQTLDRYRLKDIRSMAQKLLKAGIACTVHAPFSDLSPGAFDLLVRRASVRRLEQGLRAARYFRPQVVVLHSGYHPGYHRERISEWQKMVVEGLKRLVEIAERYELRLALENVFEPEPQVLTKIVEEINSPYLGYCFDAGHAFAFAKSSWQPWLEAFRGRLFEMHLHDNDGSWDDHLPPGQGKIPFLSIFQFLKEHHLRPSFTFEAHREEDVWPGLVYLAEALNQTGLLGLT